MLSLDALHLITNIDRIYVCDNVTILLWWRYGATYREVWEIKDFID